MHYINLTICLQTQYIITVVAILLCSEYYCVGFIDN